MSSLNMSSHLVAVITEASSGVGEAMAHSLDINGAATVFIIGRREYKLNEFASKAVCNSDWFYLITF